MCQKIEALLKERIGLDVSSVGSVSVENAIKRCLVGAGYDDLTQYYKALVSSDIEFKRLVEAVVIPETWFFRDEIPFEVLEKRVNSGWSVGKDKTRKLKVLSIPCSTGEEPYTIAMVLDKIGFPAERAQIDAIDISQSSLEKAMKGVYRENSFRSDNLSFRSTYFIKTPDGYCLKSMIRDRVNFKQGNLLKDDFSIMKGDYDVIFCRNLLIYFDGKDQQSAVNKLSELLAPDGVLFVGHAEANNNINRLFRSLRLRGAFAFVKQDVTEGRPAGTYGERFYEFSQKREALTSTLVKPPANESFVEADVIKPFSEYAENRRSDDEDSEKDLLSKACLLADEGALDKAEVLCDEIIARFSSADAYSLLGVVYEASNRQDMAESMFRKALYLEPDHEDALVHLALHVERNGNVNEAISLRRRAERAGS